MRDMGRHYEGLEQCSQGLEQWSRIIFKHCFLTDFLYCSMNNVIRQKFIVFSNFKISKHTKVVSKVVWTTSKNTGRGGGSLDPSKKIFFVCVVFLVKLIYIDTKFRGNLNSNLNWLYSRTRICSLTLKFCG